MSVDKLPIPIKNIFYMLCYAWNVLAIKDDMKVGMDKYDDAYNLLGLVFSYGIGKVIRSGFHRSYIEQEEELSTLRGKINVQESINRLSKTKQKLVCNYDEYSTDDLFNQILKYTIESLIKNANVDIAIKRELKKQIIFFGDIQTQPPTKTNRKKLIFNRNNVTYKLLINIAILLYDNTTINEEDGSQTFKDFFRQEQMHKVFEMFILNFYAMHLPKSDYKVHAPKINWHLEDDAESLWGELFDVDKDLVDRRTDIVVENKPMQLQLIIDAKYYKRTFVAAYMNSDDEKVRTGHLNQIRGYVLDSDFEGKKVGALIYPMVNSDLSRGKVQPIKGTPIILKTINLNADWSDIEKDMLSFIHKIEKVAKNA